MVKEALGRRMKENYEYRTRLLLPRRTYTIVRLDGRAFHTYTQGLDRPYDHPFMIDMGITARYLCEQVAGCRFAYTQSDEISLLLTDFTTPQTEAWFDGNQQKIVSVTASLATAKFNELRRGKLAGFDSRAFTIPDPVEVGNYFVWRQQDAMRNSVNMVAQTFFTHAELLGKSSGEVQEMLWSERGVNWNDYDPRFKRGTLVTPQSMTYKSTYTYMRRVAGELELEAAPDMQGTQWTCAAPPIFGGDHKGLVDLIPAHPGRTP